LNVISLENENATAQLEHALEFAAAQVCRLIERDPDYYPMYTRHGKWKHDSPAWTPWCDGFLPGMMWIFASRAGVSTEKGAWWKEQAIRYTRPLAGRKNDRDVHDLGFLFMSTYHRWQRIEPDTAVNQVLIEAGRTLAERFQEHGGYLRSFVSEDSLFIDIMMNVGIVFYAARETGDNELMDKAARHCLTTQRVLVRGDGSTAHEGIFNIDSGEFLRQSTHQGFRPDSCWARGLAWALYGFAAAYRYMPAPTFLHTAEMCADYYVKHTQPDGVPAWDFNAPKESREQVDTSAAAIAASGLAQLAGLTRDDAKNVLYRAASRRILTTLSTKYLAEADPAWEGVLKGGVYHMNKKLGVNESVIWGDYFFVEALDRTVRKGPGGR
jgi:unsaturated chondroitin disaccharide hydrolase